MSDNPRPISAKAGDFPTERIPIVQFLRREGLRPRLAVAMRLQEIWKAVLDLDELGPRDDFFELGGDSLAAASLMAEIELAFGLKLPMSILLEAPTVALLTDHILAGIGRTESPILIPIEPGGDGTPLILVHGLHGQVLFARHLRGRIGEGRPIFGLQGRVAPRPGGDAETVPEIAADYLGAIRAVRPQGPLILAGYCAGMLIAWEMARQLAASGRPADVLIGIDPPVTLEGDVGGPADALEGNYGSSEAFRDEARLMIAASAERNADPTIIGRGEDAVEQAVDRAERLRSILNSYRPGPLEGKVAFICSAPRLQRLRDPANPWRQVLPRSSRLYPAGDSHLELFRNRGQLVAQAMALCLKELGL
jgi:thioesterase domain-containing protein/acyl carrier protein